jgi:AcrR family transcriptional regulator
MSAKQPDGGSAARERILETAYQLFSRNGVQAVGVNRIVAEAHVAKMTLYSHFATKEDLVIAFLELREQRWTRDWLEAEINRVEGVPPPAGTLALFDALDGWVRRRDYEGCSFINTLLEFQSTERPHREAARQLEVIRTLLEGHARSAGIAKPEEFSHQLQILMMGAIVSASRGDLDAARRARGIAEALLSRWPDAAA